MEGRTVDHSALTLTQMISPQQAGRAGVAHGGEIMKLMDTAAGIVAARHGHKDTVTASVEGINFYRPVKVYELVAVKAHLTYVGYSSMEVRVDVFTEDILRDQLSPYCQKVEILLDCSYASSKDSWQTIIKGIKK